MTTEEAIQELEQLRGIVNAGGDLAPHKERIKALYWDVCHKHLRQCKCKNILKDALIEIYSQLRREITTKNSTNMAQARLVMGVVVFYGGKHYTNKNLTDDVARAFLEKFPQRKDWFDVLPPAIEKEAVVEESETPEDGAEIAPKAVKSASKPTTPKKKKNTAKRK